MIIRAYLLLLAVAAAMPYRFEYSLGPFSTFSVLDVVLLLGLALLSVVMLQRGRFYLGDWRVFLCITLPFLFAVIALPWSGDISSTVKYLIKIGSAFIIYVVVVNLAHNFPEKSIRQYWSLFFVSCILGTVGFFLQVPGFQLLELKDSFDPHLMASAYMRLTNPFIGRAPDYGPILGFGAFVMLAYSMVYKQRYYTIMSIVMTLCVLLTFTRGILLGFFMGLLFFGIVLNIKTFTVLKNLTKVMILLTPVLVVIVFNYGFELDDRTVELSQVIFEDRVTSKNVDSRFELYGIVLDKIFESPWIGYGAGVFSLNDDRGELIAAHNSYLQGFLFYGIFIGLIYMLVLIYHFKAFWKIPAVSMEGRVMRAAMGSAILMVLVVALTQPFMETSVPRVLLAFLMGLGVLSIKALEREHRASRVTHVM
jgi:hypothetical protein